MVSGVSIGRKKEEQERGKEKRRKGGKEKACGQG
jgi:hypothetical protein